MDPLSTAATVAKTATLTEKAIGLWRKMLGGSLKISTPTPGGVSKVQPWIDVEGVHTNPKVIFWLLTHDGDKYWPQNKVKFAYDGTWNGRVHGNTKAETRKCCIVLARVGDFANAAFEDYKSRGNRTKDWGPISLPHKTSEFKILEERIITIFGSDNGGQQNQLPWA